MGKDNNLTPDITGNNRDEKGQFIQGTSGNLSGRPIGTGYIKILEEAIEKIEKNHDKTILERFVERAYYSDRVMIALMDKLIPDAKPMELKEEKEPMIIRFVEAGPNDYRSRRDDDDN